MLRRLVSALAILSIAGGVALAQAKQKNTQRDSVRAADFSVHLFFEASGELSPNIFPLEEFAAFNFSAQWKGNNGGKFSGFLIRVRLESRTGTEVFAEGRVAQLILRERKTKKTLQTWNIADVYVGDRGVSYRAHFFSGLDCQSMEATLTSGGRHIVREIPFACGE